jgi:NAD(P)-dependent dehydrogenase (short-subunit alcohol dehydrogenase family)
MPKLGSVFVTGGASGIGLAIARGLLDAGRAVVVADFEAKNLEQARRSLPESGGKVRFERLDVTDEAGVARVLAQCDREFGPLAGLVNSAGIGKDVPFLDTTTELLRRMLEVNLVGSFVAAREAARLMRGHGGGSIVHIASVSGIRGNFGRSAYGASKGAVITLTRVMAVELAPLGIRVNAIAPGPVETPMVREMHSEAVRSRWLGRIPQARYATPEEIAGAALFLLDDARSSFVTGQVLSVDGGFTAGGLMGE